MYKPSAPPVPAPTPADLLAMIDTRHRRRASAPTGPAPKRPSGPVHPPGPPPPPTTAAAAQPPPSEVRKLDPRIYAGSRVLVGAEARWPEVGYAMLARVLLHTRGEKALGTLPPFGSAEEAVAFHLLPRLFLHEREGITWIRATEAALLSLRIRGAEIDPLDYLDSVPQPNPYGVVVDKKSRDVRIPFEHCMGELAQRPELADGCIMFAGGLRMRAVTILHDIRARNASERARAGLWCGVHRGAGACFGDNAACAIDPRVLALGRRVLKAFRSEVSVSSALGQHMTVAEVAQLAPLCVRSGLDRLLKSASLGHQRTVALTFFMRACGVDKDTWIAHLSNAARVSGRPAAKAKEDKNVATDVYRKPAADLRAYGCVQMRELGFECHEARDIEDAHMQCADQLLVPLRYSKASLAGGTLRTAWHPCMYAREALKQKKGALEANTEK